MSIGNAHPLVAVFGAGSIGCYLGGRLIQGGQAVRFIGRERYQSAIAENGLMLSRFDERADRITDVDFHTSVEALTGAGIIALCVKSQDTAQSIEAIRSHAPQAWVISFQNGVSNRRALLEGLGHGRVSAAVVPFNVTSPQPGLFHQGTDGPLVIGPDMPQALQEGFGASGMPFLVEPNIDGYLWAKLLVNLNNALNTLSGGPLRDGLLQRDYRRVLIEMIEEGLAIARLEGVSVAKFNGRTPQQLIKLMDKPDWLYRFLMDRIARIDRTARSSMLDDLDQGRQNELDYLQGEIVKLARRHDLPVSVNEAVMSETLRAFEKGVSPKMSGKKMRREFLSALPESE